MEVYFDSNTIGHQSINGLCCYVGIQKNLFFFLVSINSATWEPNSICYFPNFRRPGYDSFQEFWEKCGLIFGTAADVVAFGRGDLGTHARFNGFTLRSYTSIEPSQSSLLLWVVVVLLLRSQIGTAFSTQISSFVAWTEWNHPPFWICFGIP